MINLANGKVTARVGPDSETLIRRTDTDTLVLEMDRNEVLALIAELTEPLKESGDWPEKVKLVMQGTEHVTFKQTHFEEASS